MYMEQLEVIFFKHFALKTSILSGSFVVSLCPEEPVENLGLSQAWQDSYFCRLVTSVFVLERRNVWESLSSHVFWHKQSHVKGSQNLKKVMPFLMTSEEISHTLLWPLQGTL